MNDFSTPFTATDSIPTAIIARTAARSSFGRPRSARTRANITQQRPKSPSAEAV